MNKAPLRAFCFLLQLNDNTTEENVSMSIMWYNVKKLRGTGNMKDVFYER